MFLTARATEPEYFDHPFRTAAEVERGFAFLDQVNGFFDWSSPFKRRLPAILGAEQCRSLSLLDLGAGSGMQGDGLESWAARRGWSWRVTHLDLNPLALQLSRSNRKVAASALQLPWLNDSFDVVIASQMTHHLASSAEVVQHFREAWRVARDTLFIYDLHRNIFFCGLLWLLLTAMRVPDHFRADGLLSVRRGWRVHEWRRFASQAEIPNARVFFCHGTRVILAARKAAALNQPPFSPRMSSTRQP